MSATDKNHAKAEIKALQRLLKIVGSSSFDHRDGRTEVMEAIYDKATPSFIKDLTGALLDAVESGDQSEIGRVVRAHVMAQMRAHPKFESYVAQALADLDEADREEEAADDEFEANAHAIPRTA